MSLTSATRAQRAATIAKTIATDLAGYLDVCPDHVADAIGAGRVSLAWDTTASPPIITLGAGDDSYEITIVVRPVV